MPRKPPVPIFGAQKTGSPTHLISQTYEAMLRRLGRTFARMDPMYGESAGTRLAAQTVVHGVEVVADVPDMGHGADETEMRRQTGQTLVQLGEVHAGDRRGNGLVRAANFRGCRGLQVPRIEVTGPAAQPDQDAGLLRGTAAETSFALQAGRDRSRATESQGADPTGLEKLAARDQGGLLSLVAGRKTHRSVPGKRVVLTARHILPHAVDFCRPGWLAARERLAIRAHGSVGRAAKSPTAILRRNSLAILWCRRPACACKPGTAAAKRLAAEERKGQEPFSEGKDVMRPEKGS